jgi:hypothetical protein
MSPTTRVRPRIGGIIEIPTPDGFAYAQFTHRHTDPPKYGSLLRILPGLFKGRPDDFSRLLAQTPSFSTFFPLGAACHRGIVRVVAEEPIPSHTRDFPIFRNSHRDRTGKRVPPWFLWDGRREWRTPTLTDEQLRDYPPLGVWNDTMLIQRIMSGWRNEHDR